MSTIQTKSLYFKEGSSDKEYHLQLNQVPEGYEVCFQYGRCGSALNEGKKTKAPIELAAAQKIYAKVLAEKVGKGYTEGAHKGNYVSAASVSQDSDNSYTDAKAEALRNILSISEPKAAYFIPQLLNDIDEEDIEKYLLDDTFGAQEKKDGRHQAIYKAQGKAGEIRVTNKKGQAIGYPADLAKALITDSTLQMDAEIIGQTFNVFDLLEFNGQDLRGRGYKERYDNLKAVFNYLPPSNTMSIVLVPLAIGYKAKKALYLKLKKEGREGIVFKKLDAPFSPGRPDKGGDMLKCKFYKELSVRVATGRAGKRSIGMELLNDQGAWVKMGNCTIPPNKEVPAVGTVVEIRYLYAYKGGSLYQPTYKEPRDDVYESECKMTQVKYKAEED